MILSLKGILRPLENVNFSTLGIRYRDQIRSTLDFSERHSFRLNSANYGKSIEWSRVIKQKRKGITGGWKLVLFTRSDRFQFRSWTEHHKLHFLVSKSPHLSKLKIKVKKRIGILFCEWTNELYKQTLAEANGISNTVVSSSGIRTHNLSGYSSTTELSIRCDITLMVWMLIAIEVPYHISTWHHNQMDAKYSAKIHVLM